MTITVEPWEGGRLGGIPTSVRTTGAVLALIASALLMSGIANLVIVGALGVIGWASNAVVVGIVMLVGRSLGYLVVAGNYLIANAERLPVGWPDRTDWGWIAGGTVVAATVLVAAPIALIVIAETSIETVLDGLWTGPLSVVGLAVLVRLGIVIPAEEVLFRGAIQDRIRACHSAPVAIGVASLPLAALQTAQLLALSPAAVLVAPLMLTVSVVAGLVYERTGTVLGPVVVRGGTELLSTTALVVVITAG